MLYYHYAHTTVHNDNPLVKGGYYADIRALGYVLRHKMQVFLDTFGVQPHATYQQEGWIVHWPDYLLPKDEQAVANALGILKHAHPNGILGDPHLGLLAFSSQDDFNQYVSHGQVNTPPQSWAITAHVWDVRIRHQLLQYSSQTLQARHFNAVTGDQFILSKTSSNISKIKAEYDYYYLLPDSFKRWFVQPFHWEISGDTASYQMERLHIPDLAAQAVNNRLSALDLRYIFQALNQYIQEQPTKECTQTQFTERLKSLYLTKVEQRLEQLKAHPSYTWLSHALSLTPYHSLDHLWTLYLAAYQNHGKRKLTPLKLIHGDLCFSNILYDPSTHILRLIDPRGASTQEDLYDDPWYDLAKLSHAVMGQYDFLNQGYYDVVMPAHTQLGVHVHLSRPVYYRQIFEEWLQQQHVPLSTIRLYEASLFLSMLPLHVDKPRNVLAFAIQAGRILTNNGKEIE